MQTSISTTVPETQTATKLMKLTQWIKAYATYAGVTTVKPELNFVMTVARSYLSDEQLDISGVDELLRSVGIDVIAQYGSERVAWLGSTSEPEVEEMLEKYQQPAYSHIRKALGVDYLWILKIQDDLGHTKNDIFEAFVEFSDMDEKTECIIIDL